MYLQALRLGTEVLDAETRGVPYFDAVRRQGDDLTIITYGAMLHTALDAAAALDADGVATTVVARSSRMASFNA